MGTLALQLAGPLQSWGVASRFVRRSTSNAPTKSGIVGLIAAAQGRRRSDPVEDLVALRLGVRIDQPGELVRDFQTAIRWEVGPGGKPDPKPMPLSYRYYLGDAVFLAVVEGPRALLDGIADAIRSPVYPLYLGRRSCPPARPLILTVTDDDLPEVLTATPWLASAHAQRAHRARRIPLATIMDAEAAHASDVELVQDLPLSFDPNLRQYGWRRVQHGHVEVDNPYGTVEPADRAHDPMAVLGG